ncbi:MAG: AraC family transcriptional regulator [Bacteroidota bacterium]
METTIDASEHQHPVSEGGDQGASSGAERTPEEVLRAIHESRARVFFHTIVMEAVDLSMALDRHVLLYGLEGLFLMETDRGSWRLPPSRAAWLPAGTHVQTTNIKRVKCASIFFAKDFAPAVSDTLQVFSVSPVMREMIKHAQGWSASSTEKEAHMERFLLTLLELCIEQMALGRQLVLPKARSEQVVAALSYTEARLAEPVRLEEVAAEVAMTPRTLMRKLKAEIRMPWGDFLRTARMLRAMECLANDTPVTETAFAVGYTNMAAFSTAFKKHVGMSPSEYRTLF